MTGGGPYCAIQNQHCVSTGSDPAPRRLFQIGAAIKAGIASGLRVYMRDKSPRLFEVHAGAGWILFEIERQQYIAIIADD